MKRTGQCLCGDVHYEVEGEPILTATCHCKNCQRQAGSALSIIAGFPPTAVSVDGELKAYADTGESGGSVIRKFCPNCGSPILSEISGGMLFIKAGTFDETDWLEPTVHFWTKSAQSWVEFGDIAQVEANPVG